MWPKSILAASIEGCGVIPAKTGSMGWHWGMCWPSKEEAAIKTAKMWAQLSSKRILSLESAGMGLYRVCFPHTQMYFRKCHRSNWKTSITIDKNTGLDTPGGTSVRRKPRVRIHKGLKWIVIPLLLKWDSRESCWFLHEKMTLSCNQINLWSLSTRWNCFIGVVQGIYLVLSRAVLLGAAHLAEVRDPKALIFL